MSYVKVVAEPESKPLRTAGFKDTKRNRLWKTQRINFLGDNMTTSEEAILVSTYLYPRASLNSGANIP